MGLTVVYRETAAPALRRLRYSDRAAFARVRGIVSALADDPYPDSAVPWGDSGYYRLHAGDLRVLYEVDEKAQAVYVSIRSTRGIMHTTLPLTCTSFPALHGITEYLPVYILSVGLIT